MNDAKPRFLVTIDTEGDNLWSRPREITTRNAAFLPRFQALCERYGLKPTWLTNYEMACCPMFREFGRDVVRRGAGEIGMHLHAWNSPPIVPLTDDDFFRQPYLTEFPPAVMREKVARLTELLESTFECKMVSHRSGRWGFDATYARLLIDAGYQVDCSVTPYVSWVELNGGVGGCDYAGFPDRPYFLDVERIERPGDSPLLELPMTIRPRGRGRVSTEGRNIDGRNMKASKENSCQPYSCLFSKGLTAINKLSATVRRIRRHLFPTVTWLRPDGRNLRQMLRLLGRVQAEQSPYAQFMLHSSELMPGGSPRFATERRTERLYEHLEQLFETAAGSFRGATLAEFRREISGRGISCRVAESLSR
jgi:hypothetical protein